MPTPCITRRCCSGFTLIELAVVMAVLGLVAVAASSMLGASGVVASIESKQEAQHLALALRTARNTAITSGQIVRVEAIGSGRDVIGFRTLADNANWQTARAEHGFPERLQVSWSVSSISFQPTGMCDRSLTVQLRGPNPNSSWDVNVVSASGGVEIIEQ